MGQTPSDTTSPTADADTQQYTAEEPQSGHMPHTTAAETPVHSSPPLTCLEPPAVLVGVIDVNPQLPIVPISVATSDSCAIRATQTDLEKTPVCKPKVLSDENSQLKPATPLDNVSSVAGENSSCSSSTVLTSPPKSENLVENSPQFQAPVISSTQATQDSTQRTVSRLPKYFAPPLEYVNVKTVRLLVKQSKYSAACSALLKIPPSLSPSVISDDERKREMIAKLQLRVCQALDKTVKTLTSPPADFVLLCHIACMIGVCNKDSDWWTVFASYFNAAISFHTQRLLTLLEKLGQGDHPQDDHKNIPSTYADILAVILERGESFISECVVYKPLPLYPVSVEVVSHLHACACLVIHRMLQSLGITEMISRLGTGCVSGKLLPILRQLSVALMQVHLHDQFIDELKADDNIQREIEASAFSTPASTQLKLLMHELASNYVLLEHNYFTSAIPEMLKKDVLKKEFSTNCHTFSSIDDIYYLFTEGLLRSEDTCDLSCLCGSLNTILSCITSDIKTILFNSVEEWQKGTRRMDQFLIILNSIDTCSEYTQKFQSTAKVTLPKQFSGIPLQKSLGLLEGFSQAANEFREKRNSLCLKLVTTAMGPLQWPLQSSFSLANYALSEADFLANEINGVVPEDLLTGLESLLAAYTKAVTPSVFEHLVSLLAGEIANNIEALISEKNFTLFGGLQFTKDIQIVMDFLSQKHSVFSCQVKFARIKQVALVLSVEKVSDVEEYKQATSAWCLNDKETLLFLSLRTDLRDQLTPKKSP
ncbi:conserved oligomeric Golgi complex subunit 4 [Pelomyxa schiedti]|nr:conserved oligomeric Golgi complex subunit 4 [Pelomyxa schiedti]